MLYGKGGFMNHQTEKKAKEIQELIKNGYNLKDILQKKFNRSNSKLKEHLEKVKDIYTNEELKVLEGMEENQVSILEKEPIKTVDIFKMEEMEVLKELIKNGGEILNLIKNKNNFEIKDHLLISDRVMNLKDYKITSIRLSKEIEQEFNELCEVHKGYSKTMILNYALEEFIKKYK